MAVVRIMAGDCRATAKTMYLYKTSTRFQYYPEITAGYTGCYRLVGLVVKASTSRAEGPGFESRLRRDFFGVESYQ